MNGLRSILVKAEDSHIVREHDSIDVPCHGLMAPALACNSQGLQVWKPRVMELREGRAAA